jgi:putative aminopeptidase FrvX
MPISDAARREHHRWLLELTQVPTAAGREQLVIAWIAAWVNARPSLLLATDSAGNLHISPRESRAATAPVYFTAHLDHPAFTVERVLSPGAVQVGFRGGVMDDYFRSARVTLHAAEGPVGCVLVEKVSQSGAFPAYIADLDSERDNVRVGDVATWELPPAQIVDDLLHTHACDDLAALAAALAAYDTLLTAGRLGEAGSTDVRLFFTRAEEVGFIGAIAACRGRSIPENARVIALENSRSFDDSPIGGGPIVRVGDRLSVFSPGLSAAIARRAEEIAGGASPTASQKLSTAPAWKWQRKLMAGGACEATVFCSYGYEATCLCLPLGNYHNMGDLAAVQAATNTSPPRVAPEFISISDFDGLVDLLVACGEKLEAAPSVRQRIDKLWTDKGFVLSE